MDIYEELLEAGYTPEQIMGMTSDAVSKIGRDLENAKVLDTLPQTWMKHFPVANEYIGEPTPEVEERAADFREEWRGGSVDNASGYNPGEGFGKALKRRATKLDQQAQSYNPGEKYWDPDAQAREYILPGVEGFGTYHGIPPDPRPGAEERRQRYQWGDEGSAYPVDEYSIPTGPDETQPRSSYQIAPDVAPQPPLTEHYQPGIVGTDDYGRITPNRPVDPPPPPIDPSRIKTVDPGANKEGVQKMEPFNPNIKHIMDNRALDKFRAGRPRPPSPKAGFRTGKLPGKVLNMGR